MVDQALAKYEALGQGFGDRTGAGAALAWPGWPAPRGQGRESTRSGQ